MKAMITGGAGFVGSNLAAFLLARGARVWVFDSLARAGSTENLAWLRSLPRAEANLEFTHGDIRDPFAVERLVGRLEADVVFHLAGQVAMTTSLEDPRRDFGVNALGSLHVLEAVRERSPGTAVVYASSNKVYGNLRHLDLVEGETRYRPRSGTGGTGDGIDETTPIEFHTPYGCSKGAADQYMLDYARCFGLRTVVLRHSTIYGGRQFATYDQGWVGWFVRQALAAREEPGRAPFTVSGDGKQVRDLLYVTDAVACYVAMYERIEKTAGEAFNIGGGAENAMSVLELLHDLERRLAVRLDWVHLPWRAHDQKYFVADNGKAGRLAGWTPATAKDAGIENAVAWEMEQMEVAVGV